MKRNTIVIGSLIGVGLLAAVAFGLAGPSTMNSGVEKGGMLSAFDPHHVTGADKNTNTCPT